MIHDIWNQESSVLLTFPNSFSLEPGGGTFWVPITSLSQWTAAKELLNAIALYEVSLCICDIIWLPHPHQQPLIQSTDEQRPLLSKEVSCPLLCLLYHDGQLCSGASIEFVWSFTSFCSDVVFHSLLPKSPLTTPTEWIGMRIRILNP